LRRNLELEQKILEFLYKWLRPIRIGDLKQELQKDGYSIPHSTLNSTIERLQERDFVKWKKYGPVALTEFGWESVAHKQRHFHLFSMYLSQTLGISHDQAQNESYKIAGILSCELIDKIAHILNEPEKCICNEVIPKIDECTSKIKT